jgi:hypothetical protein
MPGRRAIPTPLLPVPALLALLALLVPSGAAAESVGDRATEEEQILTAHRTYGDAVRASDWAKAATCFDPAALAGLRAQLHPVFLMADDGGKTVGEELLGVPPAGLDGLDDAEFFGAFMRGIMALDPSIGEAMASAEMIDKGVAFGAEPAEAYVVYEMRLASGDLAFAKLAVTPMVRGADGAWALQMTGEFQGLADHLTRMAAAQPAADAAATEPHPEGDASDPDPEDAPIEDAPADPPREKGRGPRGGRQTR